MPFKRVCTNGQDDVRGGRDREHEQQAAGMTDPGRVEAGRPLASRPGRHQPLCGGARQRLDERTLQPLEDGTEVHVLGFREHASWALASDTLEFVDLEDIPGVFREPLPRIGLDSLPEQGAWLQPFRPLSSLLTSRVG